MSDFHPLVELMLARMQSHPEEFTEEVIESDPYESTVTRFSRWGAILRGMADQLTPDEQAAIKAALRDINMPHLHEVALDELLNGEARRCKEREEQEERDKAYRAMQTTMMSAGAGNNISALQNSALQAQAQNAYQQIEIARQQMVVETGVLGEIKKGLGL